MEYGRCAVCGREVVENPDPSGWPMLVHADFDYDLHADHDVIVK